METENSQKTFSYSYVLNILNPILLLLDELKLILISKQH